MKLPIKKEFFDQIKAGTKKAEFREAHITFVCEETGEELRKEVHFVEIVTKDMIHRSIRKMFKEDKLILFGLE